jgi:predicted Zn-dependent protease
VGSFSRVVGGQTQQGEGVQGAPTTQPDAAELARLEALCDAGQHLAALHARTATAPLSAWRGPEARIVASRILHHAGASTEAEHVDLRAYRESPSHPGVFARHMFRVLLARGPLVAAERLARYVPPAELSAGSATRLLAVRHAIALALRDFDETAAVEAEWLARYPDDPYLVMLQTSALEANDRMEDATTAAEAGLARFPHHPAVGHVAARVLFLAARPVEAVAVLERVVAQGGQGGAELFLARALLEAHRPAEAIALVARAQEHLPLADAATKSAIASLRSDLAYAQGDVGAAIAYAEQAGGSFYSRLAETLRAAPATGRRVVLDVPFVRQFLHTCAPATFASIGRFFGLSASHRALADRLGHGGITAYQETRWTEEEGHERAHFTVTWEAAVALLDAGIPFVLFTQDVASGHAQGIVGYDARRGTLHVREPSSPFLHEALAAPLLASQASSGPIGFAFAPPSHAAALRALPLPDRALHERLARQHLALTAADVETSRALRDELVAEAPEHLVTLLARDRYARLVQDLEEIVRVAEGFVARFPDEPRFALARVMARAPLETAAIRLDELGALALRSPHPIVLASLADALAADASQRPRAARLLRRAHRMSPGTGSIVAALGELALLAGEPTRAYELLRRASDLAPNRDEHAARAFEVARLAGLSEHAIAWLERRAARLAPRLGPLRTWAAALAALGRKAEAEALLGRALLAGGIAEDLAAVRVDCAWMALQAGQDARVREHMDHLRSTLTGGALARLEAALAERAGDSRAALAALERAVAQAPLDVDLRGALLRHLEACDGRAAASAHVEAFVARFPRSLAAAWLHARFAEADGPFAHRAALSTLAAQHPESGHAHRSLAWLHAYFGDDAAADRALAEALAREPASPENDAIAGRIHDVRGAYDEAAQRLSVAALALPDRADVASLALQNLATAEARRALLDGWLEALLARGTGPYGALTFRDLATASLSLAELRAAFTRFTCERPEQLGGTLALAASFVDERELDAASRQLAAVATRFADEAPFHAALADVHAARGEREAERAAREQALALSPTHAPQRVRLAALREQAGDGDGALALLAEGLPFTPPDSALLAAWAPRAARAGQGEAALARLEQSLSGGSDELWDLTRSLAAELGVEPLPLCERVVAARPWDVAMVRLLARDRYAAGDAEGALALLDQTLAQQPRATELHDLRATLFGLQGRFEEALAALTPAMYAAPRVELAARRAWVLLRQGEHGASLEVLRTVLAARPAYPWALELFCAEAQRLGHTEEARWAAACRCRLAPREPGFWQDLGAMALAAGDRKEARAAYERALAWGPLGPEGLAMVVRFFLEEGDVDAARSALARSPGELDAARRSLELKLSAAAGETPAASEHLAALLADPEADVQTLVAAHEALVAAGLGEVSLAAHGAALAAEAPSVATVTRAHLVLLAPHESVRRASRGLSAGVRARGRLLAAHALHVANQGSDYRALGRALLAWPAARTDHVARAFLGRALLQAGHPWLALTTLRAVTPHPQALSMAFADHVAAASATLHFSEAGLVATRALARRADGYAATALLFVAVQQVAAGRDDAARGLLARLEPGSLTSYGDAVASLARLPLAVDEGPADERSVRLAEARVAFAQTRQAMAEGRLAPRLGGALVLATWGLARRSSGGFEALSLRFAAGRALSGHLWRTLGLWRWVLFAAATDLVIGPSLPATVFSVVMAAVLAGLFAQGRSR